MRILGFEITRWKSEQKALTGYVSSPGAWSSLFSIGESFAGAWQKNIEVKTGDVLSHWAAFRSISLIKSDISKMPIRLMEKNPSTGVSQERDSAAFSPVLRRPNRFQNRIQFIDNWMESKLIHGNTYVLKQRDNRGVVVALYVLDPLRTHPFVSPDGDVFYQVAADNLARVEDSVMLPASEVIHDRWNTFYHPLMGLSPIAACGLNAIQGLRIQNNQTRFFANQSRPSIHLSAPGKISPETAASIKEGVRAATSGESLGGILLTGDGLKAEMLTMSAEDSQLIEQLKWSAETVAGCYGVPGYKLNIGDPPNFNNVAALNDQYYSQALQQHIESIELLLDEELALRPKYHTRFDLDALLRMDPMAQVEAAEKGVGSGIWSPNEARQKFDMVPVEGGETPYLQEQNWPLRLLANRELPTREPTAPALLPENASPDDEGEGAPPAEERMLTQVQLERILEDAAREFQLDAA